jgi:hypothetical protein
VHWTLSRAVCIAGVRSARNVLAANPVLALLAGAALVGAPASALVGGRRLAAGFREALVDPAFARGLGFGIAATAVTTGVVIALLAPAADSTARQLEAAPVDRLRLVLAATIVPTALASAVFAAPALLFVCFLAGAAAPTLVLVLTAAGVLGAAGAEGVRLALADAGRGVSIAAAAVALWLLAGLALGGGVALGPAGAVVRNHGLAAPFVLGCVAVIGFALWAAACAARRPDRVRSVRTRSFLRVPRRPFAAVAIVTAKRLGRHSGLRAHEVATVALPTAAAITLRFALGVGGAPLVAFCVSLGLTAAAIVPAAAVGLAADARWLTATAPQTRVLSAAAAACAGVACAAALVAADAAAVAPVARADAYAYAQLEAAAAFVLGCAAGAAALVPWKPGRVVQQIAAYGAMLGVAIVVWLVLGRVAAVAPVSDDVFGVIAGNATLVAGLGAAAWGSR